MVAGVVLLRLLSGKYFLIAFQVIRQTNITKL